jgi:tRNA (mo5U34)-methyltransferase
MTPRLNPNDLFKNEKVDTRALKKNLAAHNKKLKTPQYARYAEALKIAQKILRSLKAKPELKIKDNIVYIGDAKDLNPTQHADLRAALKLMMPWRKGPFCLFGELIDAEWRSDQKWERLKKHVGSLQGKKILDIGCNNGYYLYLMAKQKPRLALGIDPVAPYFYQFEFLKTFHAPQNAHFGLFGVDELTHFEKVFDVVFCMGILYHHADPIGILKKIFQSLRPGGQLIVESQGVNVAGSFFHFPQNRYALMPGHWFLPSREALENLLRRSGFQYVETFFETKLLPSEQRRTIYAPYESLSDGLNAENPDLTVENYPAPWRFYVKARKARIRR